MERTYTGGAGEARACGRAEPVLAWRVHLLKENPSKALVIAPFLFLGLLVCHSTFHSLLFSALVLFLLLASLADFFFPVRYEITREGASARTLFSRTFISWDRVKKYYLDDHGIKLSPLRNQGRLEAYRGVYLRFGDRRDEVVEAVRRMRDVLRADSGDGRASDPGRARLVDRSACAEDSGPEDGNPGHHVP